MHSYLAYVDLVFDILSTNLLFYQNEMMVARQGKKVQSF